VVTTLGARLRPWSDYADEEWPTLFVGNGLSINVWHGFSYDRLYDQAALDTAAIHVFEELGTTNFEAVLEALMHAEIVLSALRRRTTGPARITKSVRNALFNTVRAVHVPWQLLPAATLSQVATTMDGHDQIFTTNYDLIPYWALMETASVKIANFFWGNQNTFDANQTDLHAGYSALYFLHGCLHLWQSDATGLTGKWTSQGHGLLWLGTLFSGHKDRRPLFVSEGSARGKRRTIRRSDYLTFCLERLRDDESDTVVFGAGLNPQDDHIVAALRNGRRRRIAIALRSGTRETILGRKGFYTERLRGQRVMFFDASTHRLGDPALTVPVP
jgi:Domain of unknown function (DUF4917)